MDKRKVEDERAPQVCAAAAIGWSRNWRKKLKFHTVERLVARPASWVDGIDNSNAEPTGCWLRRWGNHRQARSLNGARATRSRRELGSRPGPSPHTECHP